MSHLSRVVCGTCGRDNAPNLVFCQDCGARLAARIAPPTPPIGLTTGGAPFVPNVPPAPADPPASPEPSPVPPSGTESPKVRPAAPDFTFLPRDAAAPPSAAKPEPPKPAKVRCPSCGGNNAPHLRFCITCGSDLAAKIPPPVTGPMPILSAPTPARVEPSVSPRPAPAPSPSPGVSPFGATATPEAARPAPPRDVPQPAASPITPATPPVAPAFAAPPPAVEYVGAPIAPTPMIDLGGRPSAKPTVRVCARCHGSSDPTSQFCKFCGAPLADPPTPSPRVNDAPTVPVAALEPAPQAPPARVAPAPPQTPVVAEAPVAPVAPAAPAPRAARQTHGRLITIAKDGGEGESHPLSESLDIGRLEGDIVVPEDRYVSPRHARLTLRDGQLRLRDLGSTNGIYLKVPGPKPRGTGGPGARPSEHDEIELLEVPLEDQDLILLGQQVIRFEVVKGAEEGLGPAVQHGTLLFGTPASPRYARLCQRTVEGVVRDVFYVRKPETVLGRESGDVVFPDDPFLSRRHAVIRTDAAKKAFFLADFGSSNGTFLQIRGEVSLQHGDEFRVGQQLFRVDLAAPQRAS